MPKNIKNASDLELEDASSSCEKFAIWCGVFVVLSVGAELVIALYDPPYEVFLKLSIWPDAVIGLGIVGEVLFGMWDSSIQTELRRRSNERLGEANKDAADARARTAEIEKLTAWRDISDEAHEQIAADLKYIAPTLDLVIEYQNGDAEAVTFAAKLANALVYAGMPVETIHAGPNMLLVTAPFGVQVSSRSEVIVEAVTAAFKKAGVVCDGNLLGAVALPKKQPPENLWLFVGSKPGPMYTPAKAVLERAAQREAAKRESSI